MSFFAKTVEFLTNVAAPRMDSIQNSVTGLGTREDNATYGEPTLGRRLTYQQIQTLYATSDLAQRIVDEIVDDALRQGFVARDAESNETIDEPEELNIISRLGEAIKEARLGGGAGILLVTKGAADLSKPLDISKPTTLLNLVVLDSTELSVVERDYDLNSPTFGEPLIYSVTPRGVSGYDGSLIRVHRSRLLVFRGQRLPRFLRYANNEWDDSVLQACWDRIRNFEQTELAMGNIVQRFEIATYSIDGLGEILETLDGREKILQRLQLIQRTVSMVRAVVLDKAAGETYERNFTSVNGLDTIWDRLAHSVAKAARMPMTQLFGTSPSGLATDDESGRANWRKQIKTLQTREIEPALRTYFRIINDGKPVKIIFHALDETTATEEAEIAKLRAETREKYIAMGAAAPGEFREHLVREGIVVKPSVDEGDLDFGLMNMGNPDGSIDQTGDDSTDDLLDDEAEDEANASEDEPAE